MELEVGMYVRTEDGEILKIKYIEDIYTSDDIYIAKVIHFGDSFHINSDVVIKASHNIIDLIEPGDYVNGYIVLEIIKDNLGKTYIECGCKDEIAYNYIYDTFYNEDIKSIVTREQFSTIEYRLGDK